MSFGIAGERGPAERSACRGRTEDGCTSGTKPGKANAFSASPFSCACCTDVVAVVERDRRRVPGARPLRRTWAVIVSDGATRGSHPDRRYATRRPLRRRSRPWGYVPVERIVGGRLVGQRVGRDVRDRSSVCEEIDRVAHDQPMDTASPAAAASIRARGRSRRRGRPWISSQIARRVYVSRAASDATSRRSRQVPRFIVARRAAARRPCRRSPAVTHEPALQRGSLRSGCLRGTRRRSRRCLEGCPACRCRSTSRPSSGRT